MIPDFTATILLTWHKKCKYWNEIDFLDSTPLTVVHTVYYCYQFAGRKQIKGYLVLILSGNTDTLLTQWYFSKSVIVLL